MSEPPAFSAPEIHSPGTRVIDSRCRLCGLPVPRKRRGRPPEAHPSCLRFERAITELESALLAVELERGVASTWPKTRAMFDRGLLIRRRIMRVVNALPIRRYAIRGLGGKFVSAEAVGQLLKLGMAEMTSVALPGGGFEHCIMVKKTGGPEGPPQEEASRRTTDTPTPDYGPVEV